MKLTENKKVILTGIVVLIITLTMMITIDGTLPSLFKHHNTTDTPITQINVNGNGSSGTGDVQNVETTTVVQGDNNNVAATQQPVVEQPQTDTVTGNTYTPDSDSQHT